MTRRASIAQVPGHARDRAVGVAGVGGERDRLVSTRSRSGTDRSGPHSCVGALYEDLPVGEQRGFAKGWCLPRPELVVPDDDDGDALGIVTDRLTHPVVVAVGGSESPVPSCGESTQVT